uniref:S-phase kinase-associated protein 2 n=1 Tax=Phallusia mammillata TaxID=59560 RepID=A0A6F9DSE3_9ASCI|nr:S-phase kinase-associated protein 2 [Phallusia mammillata]
MNFAGHSPQNSIKRPTRIQWILDENEKQDLYKDLGIIGELSSPESQPNKSSVWQSIAKPRECSISIESCKQINSETPSTSTCDDIKRKRELTRLQRKRTRKHGGHSESFSSAKHVRVALTHKSKLQHRSNNEKKDCLINILPDEVLLDILGYCNSETRVKCSRVCWRWYQIANDKSLWLKVSLAKKKTDVQSLHSLLKRGVQVLCLNCADIISSTERNNSFTLYDENSVNTNPCCDPFSRAYHYSVHSIDFTNASISANTLCFILMRCSILRNVSLEGLTISHNVLGCLSNCSMLEKINLCLCHELTVSGMVQVLQSCHNLVELNIAWTNLTHTNCDELFEYLPSGIQALNISGFRNTLKDHNIQALVKKCPSLREFDASDSNLLTDRSLNMLVDNLGSTLKAVNLSRCYSINPNCYLRFSAMPQLRYLDVFGVMDDASIGTLAAALPRVRVCLRPFSAVARPSPSALYGTRRRTVWGYYVV